MLIRIVPFLAAFLLLSAHFLRHGNVILVVGVILVPLILLIKRRWVVIVAQILAYLGALVWVRTAMLLYHHRVAMGQPWGRMVIILGVVALLTAISGWLLNSPKVKEKYL